MFTWDYFENPAPGIIVYKNVVKKDLDIINRINNVLGESQESGKPYNWNPAYVGYNNLMPDYRDCKDFKFKKTDIPDDKTDDSESLKSIWQDVYDVQKPAVDHYRGLFNLAELRYWEAFNFVRYTPGQHFQEHQDHGFSYNCVTSLVTYLNDDYEGGELWFRLQGYQYKPSAGDVVMFPSSYMYPHQAKPVISGTKYAIVTMLDYSDKYHKPEFYQETGT